jgi:D-beta-D-heptose 7-phosphate kinase/D-beta-D-heptose 1-phosphate adenosyltransferase
LQKGPGRPIVPEDQRAEVLAALSCVDFVVVFHESDPGRLISELQPDILVKGGDWATAHIIGRETVERQGGTVVTIPLVAGVSTTHLITKIRQTTPE